LQSGDYFGELSFITGREENEGAYVEDVCTLYSLERNTFLKIIKEFEKDFEAFCMIRDKIDVNQNLSSLSTKCFSCDRYRHML